MTFAKLEQAMDALRAAERAARVRMGSAVPGGEDR
jgi:hypothetical protein